MPAYHSPKEKDKPMPKTYSIKVDDGIIALGKRGIGKTSLIKYLIDNIFIPSGFKVVVLDVIGNYKQYDGAENVEYHLLNPRDDELVDSIIRPYLQGKQNAMFIIDEADRYTYRQKGAMNDLVNVGRNFAVGFLASARRTASIPKDFLSNAAYSFIFKHIAPRDLEVLGEWFGVDEIYFRELVDHEFILFYEDTPIFKGIIDLDKAPGGSAKDVPVKPIERKKSEEGNNPEDAPLGVEEIIKQIASSIRANKGQVPEDALSYISQLIAQGKMTPEEADYVWDQSSRVAYAGQFQEEPFDEPPEESLGGTCNLCSHEKDPDSGFCSDDSCTCEGCGFSYDYEDPMKEESSYVCPVCDAPIEGRSAVEKHLHDAHSDILGQIRVLTEEEEDQWTHCADCGHNFNSNERGMEHVQSEGHRGLDYGKAPPGFVAPDLDY